MYGTQLVSSIDLYTTTSFITKGRTTCNYQDVLMNLVCIVQILFLAGKRQFFCNVNYSPEAFHPWWSWQWDCLEPVHAHFPSVLAVGGSGPHQKLCTTRDVCGWGIHSLTTTLILSRWSIIKLKKQQQQKNGFKTNIFRNSKNISIAAAV